MRLTADIIISSDVLVFVHHFRVVAKRHPVGTKRLADRLQVKSIIQEPKSTSSGYDNAVSLLFQVYHFVRGHCRHLRSRSENEVRSYGDRHGRSEPKASTNKLTGLGTSGHGTGILTHLGVDSVDEF